MKTNYEVLGRFGPVEVRVEDGYCVTIYEEGGTSDKGKRIRAQSISIPPSDVPHLIMLLNMANKRRADKMDEVMKNFRRHSQAAAQK
jgi:hypothetical protein